jgi:hypothetical protein
VDHKNHNPADNRWCNLFEVSHQTNGRNQPLHKNNTSGRTGVGWDHKSGCWRADIGVNYRLINLGFFNTFEEAVKARKAAEKRYGFSKGHGK